MSKGDGYQTSGDIMPPRRVFPHNPDPFMTTISEQPPRNIAEVLRLLAAAVSMCWENPGAAGEFDSMKAGYLVADAEEHVKELLRNELNTLADTFGLGQVKQSGK